jgi:alkylation response protein AidB-like acyl-CoA dehydrogenase
MAEGRARAAREHRCRGSLERRDRRAADRVHTAMDPVQATGAYAVGNRVVVKSNRQHLRAGDVPVLTNCDRRDCGISRTPSPALATLSNRLSGARHPQPSAFWRAPRSAIGFLARATLSLALVDIYVHTGVIAHGPDRIPRPEPSRGPCGTTGTDISRILSAMSIATPYTDKTDEQKAICEMVRQFADEQIIPNAEHYDHEDSFPEPIVQQMRELGLFGVTIPEEYGGMGLDLTTYAMIVEELSRGWISISGIVNTHFIGSYLLMKFGTDGQKHRYLPKMATGEIRAAFSLSEPECGSDVQAIKTSARKTDDGAYEINGQKMWVTNGLLSTLVFTLVKTDPTAEPKYKGMTCFVCEKEPGAAENTGPYKGFNVPPKIKKLGYKGVESTELVFDGYKTPAESILGGEEAGLGQGFVQMMDALEVGRVNVAARGVGIAQRALELALVYSQQRKTFGREIAQHQAIQFKLADMATQVEAARLMTIRAARLKDAGERSDLEAGMAKLFASEAGRFCVEEAFRIHGGYGYSKEYEIERLYRDAPLLLIGEGTSEIQRMVIGRKLLQRHKL